MRARTRTEMCRWINRQTTASGALRPLNKAGATSHHLPVDLASSGEPEHQHSNPDTGKQLNYRGEKKNPHQG